MRKTILILLVLTSGLIYSQEKTRVAFVGGLLNATASVEFNGDKTTDSDIQYYGGVLVEFSVTSKFKIQPQLLYVSSEGSNRLSIPVIGKQYLTDKLSVIIAPQFFIDLQETGDDFSSFNISALGGLEFDIDKNFSMQTGYSFQLNNSYTGDLDLTTRINYFNFGMVFRFNE